MKKIISLFARNYDGDRLVRNEVVPGSEWVIAGEGVATRKWDGTCCLIRGGKLFKRYEIKKGGKAPPNFEPANDVDENTGKQQGWVPVGDGPEDRWHREAGVMLDWPANAVSWKVAKPSEAPDGTYELLGPNVQGGAEKFAVHVLLPHGKHVIEWFPRDFEGIKANLSACDIEGVVWHHPDGRMVKIKKKDFGLKRKPL